LEQLMARTQGQIALIAETLLTGSADDTRSLQGINASGLMAGNRAYALDVNKTFEYAPESTLAPDNDKVLAAVGGGRWLLVEGGNDPVVVRTLDDLPEPAAGVITLDATVMYLIEGELNLGANRIVASAGSGIQGGAGALIVGSTSDPLITGPGGEAFRLSNIAVTNNGSGPAVTWAGDGAGVQFWVHDVSLYGTPALVLSGAGDGDDGDNVYVYDSRFYSPAASHGVNLGGQWGAVNFIGCRFLGTGDGIRITSGEDDIDQIVLNGCEFHMPTGKTGIIQLTSSAVEVGRIVGCNFWGAGTPKDGNVVTTEWAGIGNAGLADF
jgi:hypothetical protein